jgi:hypothetical protein
MEAFTWRHLLLGSFVIGSLVAGPVAVDPVAAKAPPEPVCGVCTSALDEAAREHGVTVDRGRSTMTVRVSRNGSAEFSAEVELESGADRLENDSLRDAVVRDVSYILVEERRDLRTAVVDDELRVRYSALDVAHRTLGVVQFDAFHTRGAPPFASGGEGDPYPGADRLTLQAPPGYRLSGSHGSSHTDTAVRWNGTGQSADGIEADVTISFVPEAARFPTVRVTAANVVDWVF